MGHKWWHPEFLDDEEKSTPVVEKTFRDNPEYGSAAENVEVGAIGSVPIYTEEEDAEEYSSKDIVSYAADEDEEEYGSEDVDDDTIDDDEYSSEDEVSNPHREQMLNNIRNVVKKGSAEQLAQPLLNLIVDNPGFEATVKKGQTVLRVGGDIVEIPSKLLASAEKHILDKFKQIVKSAAKTLDDETLQLILKYKDEILKAKGLFKLGGKLKTLSKIITGGIAAIKSPAVLAYLSAKYSSKIAGKSAKYVSKHLPKIAKLGGKGLVPILGAGWLGYDVYKKTGSIWKALGAGLSGLALDFITTLMTGGSLGAATIPALLLDISGTIAIQDIATGENTYQELMEDYKANPEEYEKYFKELLGVGSIDIKVPEDRALLSAIKDLNKRLKILPPNDPGRGPLEAQLKELLQKAYPEGIDKVEGEEDIHDDEEYGDEDRTTNSFGGMDQFQFGADENVITVGDEGGTTGEVEEEPGTTGKEIIESLQPNTEVELEDEDQIIEVIKEFYSRDHNTAPGATHLQLKGASVLIGIDERRIKIPRYVFRKYVDTMADTASDYLKKIPYDTLSVDQRRYVARLEYYIRNAKGTDKLLKDRAGRLLHKIIYEAPNDVHKMLNSFVEEKKFLSKDLIKALEKPALSKSKRFAVRRALKSALYTMVPVIGAGLGAYEIYKHPKGSLLKALGGGMSLAVADFIQTKVSMLGGSLIESLGLGIIMDAYIMDKFTNNNLGGLEDLLIDIYENPDTYLQIVSDILEEEYPETFANEKIMRDIKSTYSKMPQDQLREIWKSIDAQLNASGDKKERARLQQIREVITNILIEPNRSQRKKRSKEVQNKVDESKKLREASKPSEDRKEAINDYKEGQGG